MGKQSQFYLEKNDIHISANETTLSFLNELSTNLVQRQLLAVIFPHYEYQIILPSSIARLQPVVGLWKSMLVFESHGRLTAAVDVEICSCQSPMTLELSTSHDSRIPASIPTTPPQVVDHRARNHNIFNRLGENESYSQNFLYPTLNLYYCSIIRKPCSFN